MKPTTLNMEMRAGTAGGTVLALLTNLGQDVLHMVIMTATGAIVSFIVSWCMKWLFDHIRKRT
jgi:undecaprenyl pyrophosphate phosphatase UppP